MNIPIATIVVPVYNTLDTIDRTLESVCTQTYTDIEILVIDDGSKKPTSDRCDEWGRKDPRIRCIHKENEGLGLTRNRGISEAKGKYIFFVDSDDYIDNDMIEKMTNKAEEYNAEIVSTNFYFNESKEDCLLKDGLYEDNIKSYLLPRLLGRKKTGVNDFLNVSTCTKMYLVKFLRDNGLVCKSEREYIWEDMAFNFDCIVKANRIYVMNDCFYHYCYNENSITHVYDKTKIERIIAMYSFFQNTINEKRLFENEINERLCFSVMGNIRMCIKQVVLYCNIQTAIREIRKICNTNEVYEISSEMSKENLSHIQYILNCAILKKQVVLVYLLAKCQNIKTKGQIS